MGRAGVVFAVFLLSAAVVFVGCEAKLTDAEQAEIREAVKEDAQQIVSDIDEAMISDPRIGLSSNPYDYVGISPAFERLVERGRPALDAIASEIEDSPDDGLREYLLAIAGGRILGERGSSDTGKAWAAWYRSEQ